jgi:hypothetical protein
MIKTYSEIISNAAREFDITVDEAGIEMSRRLRLLNIPKDAIVVYVNYADYNTLTCAQIAEAMNISVSTVYAYLRIIRNEWQHLFTSGHAHDAVMAAGLCPLTSDNLSYKFWDSMEVQGG